MYIPTLQGVQRLQHTGIIGDQDTPGKGVRRGRLHHPDPRKLLLQLVGQRRMVLALGNFAPDTSGDGVQHLHLVGHHMPPAVRLHCG